MLILLPLLSIFLSAPVDGPIHLRAIDPLIKVFSDTMPAHTTKSVEMNCARNEYQSWQFAITVDHSMEDVTVELGKFTHESGYTLPEKYVNWNFVGSVPLKKNTYYTPDSVLLRKAPADFPDPLLEKRTIAIEDDRIQPVWLTVFIPEDAPPGKYSADISVLSPQGGGLTWNKGISLNVYPFAIPDERHLFMTLWFSPRNIAKFHNVEMWSEEYWEVLGRYAQNMAEHRQNVVETSLPGPIERRKDGSLDIDYTRMDKWIEFFQKYNVCHRIEFPAVAHTVQEEGREWWNSSQVALNTISVKDQETGETIKLPPEEGMALLLADLDRHLCERGWQDIAMIHISDEPTIYKLESYRKAADFVHQHAPHLKTIEAIETTGFGDSLDVWVPKLSHFMNWYDEYEAQRKSGTEMWFYTCCHPYGVFPNRFIDFALIKTRLLFWLNWKYRLDGYLHWALNHWTDDPFTDVGDNLPPGDRHIIYPGKDGPMNSIRWEASREGLQDYERLWLLADKTRQVKEKLGAGADFIHEKRRSDEICNSIVRSFVDYETDPQKFRETLELLAQEIIDIDKSPLLLVQTTPQAETEVVPGPILVLVRGVVEAGATVKIQEENVVVKPDGTFAGHAFVTPGKQEIFIEAKIDGKSKQVRRHFVVKE